MASSYDDSVLNFDLGFFHQTSKNTGLSRLEKQRKAILIAKQKTITTDGLIRKYYNKKEILEQTERTLFASKEECKQICIDYKNVLEKCERLENEVQVIQHYNQQLQQKLSDAESQFCGIQSHAKQLEVLVKEQETQIESLKIENHLEKSNIKSIATSTSTLQKQNDILLQDLCILGKLLIGNKNLKPEHKAVLQKYENYLQNDDDTCNDSGADNDDDEMDFFEDNLPSPQSSHVNEKDAKKEKVQSPSVEVQEVIVVNLSSIGKDDPSTCKPNEFDGCSVCSNDIASADTGRGSSLAFSDSEKCFRSPDYLSNDNHSSPECVSKAINVNIETSPMRNTETIDIATSPIHFETPTTDPVNTPEKSIAAIKLRNIENQTEEDTYPTKIDKSIQDGRNNDNEQRQSLEAEKYLLFNSTNNFNDENSRDCEIEMILSKMQFERELITPMPSSPCSSLSTAISKVSGCQTIHNDFVCQDAAKLREENKILHASIADLAKEIVNIKSILKINPLELVDTNQNQANESNIVVPESNTVCEMNNVEVTSKTHEESNTENEDLIDIVDIVHICGSENMELSDYYDINNQEHVLNLEDTNDSTAHASEIEPPIVIIEEEQVENTSEGIMSRLEFEEDTISSPIQSRHDNLNSVNSNEPERTAESNSSDNILYSNQRARRRMRLNNLEKLRRQMIAKSKIRREIFLARSKIKKQIVRSVRQTRLNATKKKVTPADSAASLNDKTVYENAVKIMSELKSKQSKAPNKTVFKSKRTNLSNNTRGLAPKQTEKSGFNDMSPKSPKRRLLDKLSIKPTEKPFDISEIISKQSPKPIIKPIVPAQHTEQLQVAEHQNKQSLKNMQPTISVDKISKTANVEQEISCASNIENNKSLLSPSVTTRSRSRFAENPQISEQDVSTPLECAKSPIREILPKESRKRHKRISSDEKQEIEHKRILRSSNRHPNVGSSTTNPTDTYANENNHSNSPKVNTISKSDQDSLLNNVTVIAHKKSEHNLAISYDDLDMFNETKRSNSPDRTAVEHSKPKNSILCTMLDRYSLCKMNLFPKKIPDGITNTIYNLIEDGIKQINELPPNESKSAMDNLIENLQSWNVKQFLSGFMKYLQDPQRKVELYAKVNSPPAPPMTKSEQILVYIVIQLKNIWSAIDVVNYILNSIEFIMFKLNRTPEFDTIESMSHFYAVLCRYFRLKTRLRLFMLDAMYCIQFKAIALIKQCMDVWMHILPLAHMGIAKNPLVTCVVYLLHFYKCQDHFNRVQDIRNILNRKYSYQMSEWNEAKILEMFRNAICELRDVPLEKKMLRLSLIILGKRQGARWCQKNIITNILQPIIEQDSRIMVKQFCISMIGPLMKPFPVEMKVHCEIVMNLLLDILKENPSPTTEEAIFTSLIYMSKHNQNRVICALLQWHPKQVSPECQEILRDFVREKPAHAWKTILTKINLNIDAQKRTEE